MGIAVGWMSCTWALERAPEPGCNLYVIHEATYTDHFDEPAPENFPEAVAAQIRETCDVVNDLDITILRCHGVCDEYPKRGVPDTWETQLGFEGPNYETATIGCTRASHDRLAR